MPGTGGCGSQSDRWEAALSGWLPAMDPGKEGSVAPLSILSRVYRRRTTVYPQIPNPGAENRIHHLVNPRSQTELGGINSGQNTRSSLVPPRKPGKKIQLIPHDVYQVISRQTKPTSSLLPPFASRSLGDEGEPEVAGITPFAPVANGFRGACRFAKKPPVTGSGAPGRIAGSPLFMWPGGRYKSGVSPRRNRGVEALASRHSFNFASSRFVLLYT